MAKRTSRERNSWRAYNAAGDVQLVESGSGGEELGTKDKKSLIKEFVHSKKENFFGILNPTQRIIFLLLFTVWCVANAVNFVYMNLRITNVAQNTKVLQTEPKVTEVYLKKEDEKGRGKRGPKSTASNTSKRAPRTDRTSIASSIIYSALSWTK